MSNTPSKPDEPELNESGRRLLQLLMDANEELSNDAPSPPTARKGPKRDSKVDPDDHRADYL
jgi:hypothetical protein